MKNNPTEVLYQSYAKCVLKKGLFSYLPIVRCKSNNLLHHQEENIKNSITINMKLRRMRLPSKGGGGGSAAAKSKGRESPCPRGGGNIVSHTTPNNTTKHPTRNNTTKSNNNKPSLRKRHRQQQNQPRRKFILLSIVATVTISLGIWGIFQRLDTGTTINRTIEGHQSPNKFKKNLPTPPPLKKTTASEGTTNPNLRKGHSTSESSPAKAGKNSTQLLSPGDHIIDEGKCRETIKRATDTIALRTETKGDTMLSIERKQNMAELVTKAILQPHLRGDFVEAGTYIGTSSLIAAIVQKAALDNPSTCGPAIRKSRTVWIADSFVLDNNGGSEDLEAAAKSMFRKQGFQILDHDGGGGESSSSTARPQVPIKFLKGYFDDTLPNSPIENIAVLRLYGDMHSTSTIQALKALYPKVSVGGYVIVDDYGYDGEQYKNTINEYFASESLTWKHIDYGTGQGRWFQKT